MKSAPPRIAVSLPYGMSVRNVLRSAIYPRLREAAALTLLTPLASDPGFRDEFGIPGVTILPLPARLPLAYIAYRLLLDPVEGYWFTRRHGIATLRILAEALRRERPALYAFRAAVGHLLGCSAKAVGALRWAQRLFLPTAEARAALAAARPDLLFLTHPLAIQEFPLAFAARRAGIPLVALIHSWDNLTAKSGLRVVTSDKAGRMLPLRFDRVIVWNRIMERELVQYYGYRLEEIFLAGVPQFDLCWGYQAQPREVFCRSLGADPGKAIVTYAVGSAVLLRDQVGVVGALVGAMEAGQFTRPVQLVVRGHPGSDMTDLRKAFAGRPGVFFDEPSIAYSASVFADGWKAEPSDEHPLAEILSHSAVVVNVASTMALDAAVFDRPIVCVAYDGREERPYHQSVRKHYDFTHYRPVVDSGGAPLAYSPEEFVGHVNRYLEDPTLDAAGRRRIVTEECLFTDGRAGERIAKFLLEMAEVLPGQREGSRGGAPHG